MEEGLQSRKVPSHKRRRSQEADADSLSTSLRRFQEGGVFAYAPRAEATTGRDAVLPTHHNDWLLLGLYACAFEGAFCKIRL